MPEFHVVVTDFIQPPLNVEEEILRGVARVEALNACGEEDLRGRIEDADAIMMYHFVTLSESTLRRLKKCRLIVRCGVGVDNVDHRIARELGIPVANVPDYGAEEVADTAIGMILTLTRGIHYTNSRLQRGTGPWSYEQIIPIHRLRGRTLGIVGMGRIGIATALRAKSLGLRVIFYDPHVPDGRDKSIGIEQVESLKDLLRQSDIVSTHCPRTPETQHIIDATAIAQMRPGSFLINTARGGVVDAQAVLEAIERNHLRGAALDVLEVEPPTGSEPLIAAWRNPDHPAFDRIILNPHSAFYSEEGLMDMRVKGSRNCRRVLTGEIPRNVINP